MARKKKAEEHENHERWLVSYADFITLLFAFFVVMYSVSSVNEGKYRVLSASMVAAFSPTTRSLSPIQIGELMRSPPPPFQLISQTPEPVKLAPIAYARQMTPFFLEEGVTEEELMLAKIAGEFDRIAEATMGMFAQLIEDKQIAVRKHPLWLEVEIKSQILFASGSAVMADEAEQVLQRLANVLVNYPNSIVVQGFTDDQPINSQVYPSNWELSSARASSVIRTLADHGVAAHRMSSVGFGEFRPIDSNESEIGRAKNRRVSIIILANIGESEDGNELLFLNLDLSGQPEFLQQ